MLAHKGIYIIVWCLELLLQFQACFPSINWPPLAIARTLSLSSQVAYSSFHFSIGNLRKLFSQYFSKVKTPPSFPAMSCQGDLCLKQMGTLGTLESRRIEKWVVDVQYVLWWTYIQNVKEGNNNTNNHSVFYVSWDPCWPGGRGVSMLVIMNHVFSFELHSSNLPPKNHSLFLRLIQ